MTVRDLIVKMTETGELNREVVFGRVVKMDEDGPRRKIKLVEAMYPVERIWLGEDPEFGEYLAVLE